MSSLIFRLLITTRKTVLNKKTDDKKPDSLKIKLLFLLYTGLARPSDLMPELCINKSNLALLTRELEKEGMIIKRRQNGDKRGITLHLTEKGQKTLDLFLQAIEASCNSAFGSGYGDALAKLTDAADVLEFI